MNCPGAYCSKAAVWPPLVEILIPPRASNFSLFLRSTRRLSHVNGGSWQHFSAARFYLSLGAITASNVDASTNVQSSQVWIGLKRDMATNPFTWVDGSSVTFDDWFPGYPDSTSGNCAVAFPNKWSTISGTDENAFTQRYGYVCRSARSVSALTTFFNSLLRTLGGFAR